MRRRRRCRRRRTAQPIAGVRRRRRCDSVRGPSATRLGRGTRAHILLWLAAGAAGALLLAWAPPARLPLRAARLAGEPAGSDARSRSSGCATSASRWPTASSSPGSTTSPRSSAACRPPACRPRISASPLHRGRLLERPGLSPEGAPARVDLSRRGRHSTGGSMALRWRQDPETAGRPHRCRRGARARRRSSSPRRASRWRSSASPRSAPRSWRAHRHHRCAISIAISRSPPPASDTACRWSSPATGWPASSTSSTIPRQAEIEAEMQRLGLARQPALRLPALDPAPGGAAVPAPLPRRRGRREARPADHGARSWRPGSCSCRSPRKAATEGMNFGPASRAQLTVGLGRAVRAHLLPARWP